uniref:DNA-directed DNA polymerase n=1 Tax=Panagrolaimus davidi TaxID=227884 RepID=A0A914Q2H5_9BILA
MVAMSKYLLSKKRHEDFNTSRYVYRLAFDNMGAFDDPKAKFLETIQSIINQILAEDVGDLNIPFTEVRSDFVNIISNEIFKLQQSDGFSLLLDLPFNVTLTTHAPSRGKGKIKSVRSFINHNLLFDIDLNDGLCLFYSLCAAMEFYETKPGTKERVKVTSKYKSNPKMRCAQILKAEAHKLIRKLELFGNDIYSRGYTIMDVEKIQEKLDILFPVLPEKEIADYRIIVYDFETSCEEYVDEKTLEHTVVFVAAYVYCTRCIFNKTWQDEIFNCDICGPKRWYKWSAINGDDCMLNFVETILYEFDNKYKTTLLAHVGSKFDGIFVLRKLFELNISPKVIKKGNKFYLIRVPKRKDTCELAFKDSYLFMGASLDKLVTSFDLNVQSKMFYPYDFIKRENFNVELQTLPPKSMYNYRYMKEDKQKLFDEWYSKNYNTKFSLKDSLDEYCTSDVTILSHAVVAFLELFYKITKTDPFQSQTIAGACMKAYRTKYLPEQSISIMPENGYGSHDKASVLAIKYLIWISKKQNIFIQHRNTLEGEKHVAGFKLDGYVPETNTAYEILGDVFHGCPICIKQRDKIMPTGRTAEMDYEKTMERIELIKAAGLNVIIKWEHEIRNELKTNSEFKLFYDSEIIAGPISPRSALFGGRVSPQQLYAKASDGYCIKYYDVRSLYPRIMLNEYPIGVPKLIDIDIASQDVEWVSSKDIPVKGLLQVFIIPPRNLMIPVIPMRHKEKLYFSLCKTCAIYFEKINTRCEYQCNHSDNERGFLVTLTHLELGAGLDRGYKVVKYFNAYHYDTWSSDLFKGYITDFAKVKLESEGWSNEIQSEADKDKFIKNYRENFGILIDKENVKKNKPLGAIGKSLITNLWGKFCQKNDKDYVDITSDPLVIDKIMYDETKEVKTFDILNDNLAMIVSKDKAEFVKESKTSNAIIGIFTCSMARLKLYSYLEKVFFTRGAKIIYLDTDCVVFICRIDMIPLITGPYLGDLTDEFPGYKILEFCTNGCKQYAIKLLKDGIITFILKLRGITITADVAKLLHYKKFKHMVKNYGNNECIIIKFPQIMSHRTGHVYTRESVKRYVGIFQKGLIANDYTIVPFGFRKQ